MPDLKCVSLRTRRIVPYGFRMARAPTTKSRLIAFIGMAVLAAGLVFDAWLSPPLPPLGAPLLGAAAVGLMLLAKQMREADGQEIPEQVQREGAWIANTEVSLALLCALATAAPLFVEVNGMSKPSQRAATIGTLLTFAVTIGVFRYTRSRFDALIKAYAATA